MFDSTSLVGKFLIAMPGLREPSFARSVIIVCAHAPEGALGLVINRVHPAPATNVIAQLGLDWRRHDTFFLHHGGPVAPERGFILFERYYDLPGYVEVASDLYLGTNPEILQHLARDNAASRFLLALGHAGWDAGQLEGEIRDNAWLVGKLNRNLLFDLPTDSRWEAAIRQLGIDPALLVDAGRTIH